MPRIAIDCAYLSGQARARRDCGHRLGLTEQAVWEQAVWEQALVVWGQALEA